MIHCYQSNGYSIVMDVNSGAVHVVDDLVYQLVPLLEPLVKEKQGRDPGLRESAAASVYGRRDCRGGG